MSDTSALHQYTAIADSHEDIHERPFSVFKQHIGTGHDIEMLTNSGGHRWTDAESEVTMLAFYRWLKLSMVVQVAGTAYGRTP